MKELGRVIHALEQLEVMAHDHERAGPVVDEARELRAGLAVEVVRWLVEQRDWGAPDPEPCDRDEHRLATRDFGDPTVKVCRREADLVQRLVGSSLDVPVIADRVEERLVNVAALDLAHRFEHGVNAEQLGDRRVVAEREGLREVSDVAGHVDPPAGGGQLARDELQER